MFLQIDADYFARRVLEAESPPARLPAFAMKTGNEGARCSSERCRGPSPYHSAFHLRVAFQPLPTVLRERTPIAHARAQGEADSLYAQLLAFGMHGERAMRRSIAVR